MQQLSEAFRNLLEVLRERYQFRRTLHAPRCPFSQLAAALGLPAALRDLEALQVVVRLEGLGLGHGRGDTGAPSARTCQQAFDEGFWRNSNINISEAINIQNIKLIEKIEIMWKIVFLGCWWWWMEIFVIWYNTEILCDSLVPRKRLTVKLIFTCEDQV